MDNRELSFELANAAIIATPKTAKPPLIHVDPIAEKLQEILDEHRPESNAPNFLAIGIQQILDQYVEGDIDFDTNVVDNAFGKKKKKKKKY